MGFSRKIVLLTIIFLLAALTGQYLGLSSIGQKQQPVYVKQNLSIPGWQEHGIVNSDAVLDSLETDLTIFSDYTKNDRAVNLYIGFYNSLEKAKLSHAPQVCFTAQGWVMRANDKVKIKYGPHSIEVNRLILKKDDTKTLVYFWYQDGNRQFSDIFRMKLSILYSEIRGHNTANGNNAFVRISTPINGNMEAAENNLQLFATDLFPQLQKVFLQKENLTKL